MNNEGENSEKRIFFDPGEAAKLLGISTDMLEKKELFHPGEAAKLLGISTDMLGYYRRNGQINGIDAGNTTLYTWEHLKNANLTKRKPGPKSKKTLTSTTDSNEPGALAAAS